MREWLFLIAVVLGIVGLSVANASERTYSVSQVVAGETSGLIGGSLAIPAEWPSSKWAGNCSSTLIGESVLQIAAHCVSNGGLKTFSVETTRYTAKCTHHPSYRTNSTADYALCKTDKPVAGVSSFERVLTEGIYVVGDKLLLTGGGCTTPGGGSADGRLRIGLAQVRRLPNGTNYDTVLNNGAALCYGDSGGAGYLVKEDGSRFVFGVNSRGDIRTTSYMSSVWVKAAQDFYKSWSESNGVKICGLHEDALGCRSVVPPIPNHFEVDARVGKASVTLKSGFEELLEKLKLEITKLLE